MDKIVIHGGNKLSGEVRISGSKNSSLPILFSTLLTDETVKINNVPLLDDTSTALLLLSFIGKKIIRTGNSVEICSLNNIAYEHVAPCDLSKKIRASILIIGPLLARLRNVSVVSPGGCNIGKRSIDIHLEAFNKLGAEILFDDRYIKIFAKNKLNGAIINFKFPSVGATENILLASVLINGRTVIMNAACEPEIKDLVDVLRKMGAKITGEGTRNIVVYGVEKLHGFEHNIIPDRIEAATYMMAAAITNGEIVIKNVIPKHLKSISDKLKKSGLYIEEQDNEIYIKWTKILKSQNIKTSVYPGVPTDVQAQWMALMCLANGNSIIKETIFENRFLHVNELQKFGANISVNGKTVNINGVKKFLGTQVIASDIRAGAALILAGLAAKGITTISKIFYIDRGYEMFEKKLKNIGANIKRINE
ncbi:MAG: UDP-N-acetylglucosamine 1-carboxyvinyltransferase [Endomicrobium sp.]|jgi:UDP-N-acetylglucosamine 1-carboxyvinyltransferase|nr:UDP-N-acetylglucosamine 1-carboxyvinyltransferase [Endomicrobium sp.]